MLAQLRDSLDNVRMKRSVPTNFDQRRFDLVVIGGGINGAAIARDAALRGLSVLLLEKDDFASGTTSWSTRLIHGGLRYLEHFEFELVHESLVERGRLLNNAPHLVDPLPLVLPVFRGGRYSPAKLRVGMRFYDFFSRGDALPKHRWFSRKDAGARWPEMTMEGLLGAFRYFDAQATFPERLVIEQIVSAVSFGAVALNYARVVSLDSCGAVVTGVTFVDELTGHRHRVQANAIVAVAGPWVDEVLGSLEPRPNPEIGGTKGSHIFLRRSGNEPVDALYAEATSDGRPFFIIPWNDLVMIGTTDLPYSGSLDELTASDDEIAYLLTEARRLLPFLDLSREEVLFSYAGVRPLPAVTAASPGGVTRRHFLVDHAPDHADLYSVVGGKLTTHRSLAEEAVDRIARVLGNRRPCQTRDLPFPYSPGDGSEALRQELVGSYGYSGSAARRLVSIYGARSLDIATLAATDEILARPLAPGAPTTGAEFVWTMENEMALGLSDAIVRRTMSAWNADLGRPAAAGAAEIGQSHLGWTSDRAAAELADYELYVDRFRC